jgi:hypothetical protein
VNTLHIAPEHEFEAQRGLPALLPSDERILWQGSPDWRRLAINAFHLRKVALYFGAILLLRITFALSDGASFAGALFSALMLAPLAGIALALLAVVAWLSARTAVYTITDKRVVMRIGVVLSVTFNLPFSSLNAASVKQYADGTGDIPLQLGEADHIAYLHLWPHVRPWRIAQAEPMLRAVPDAARVADMLGRAMAERMQQAAATHGVATPGTTERHTLGSDWVVA